MSNSLEKTLPEKHFDRSDEKHKKFSTDRIQEFAKKFSLTFDNLFKGIHTNAEYALEKNLPTRRSFGHISAIRKASRRAIQLSEDLLFATHELSSFQTEFLLSKEVGIALNSLEHFIPKHIAFRYRLAADAGCIRANPWQIRAIVNNLVLNACESLSDRPGALLLETGCKWCSSVLFSRAAFGRELPPGRHSYISVSFDPGCFDNQQAPQLSPQTDAPDRGLGLSQVIFMIKKQRGAFLMDKSGSTTTFSVYFPLVVERESPFLTSEFAFMGI